MTSESGLMQNGIMATGPYVAMLHDRQEGWGRRKRRESRKGKGGSSEGEGGNGQKEEEAGKRKEGNSYSGAP